MPPIIISFDGNIGSGKSSIVKYFQTNFKNYCEKNYKKLNICFLEEPVNIWESIVDIDSGKNIIEKFYENNEKFSFQFQMMAYISRLSLIKEALEKNYDIIITERSIYTDKNIFAKMLFLDKKMSSIEWQIYNLWFDEFAYIVQNIKTVYIRTLPEICDNRIKKRNRQGENIPLDYLKNCHYYHDSWLNNLQNIEEGRILIINGNEETNTSLFIDNDFYDDTMNKVFQFMNN